VNGLRVRCALAILHCDQGFPRRDALRFVLGVLVVHGYPAEADHARLGWAARLPM